MTLQKLEIKLEEELLHDLKKVSNESGRSVEELIKDALQHYFKLPNYQIDRKHVMRTYLQSVERFDGLYKKLAE